MNNDATKKVFDDRQREPLLVGDAVKPQAIRDAGYSWWLKVLGFAFLTFNLGIAIYRSEGDPAAVGFIAFSYLNLLLLFYCLRRFENSEPESAARGKHKLAVWVLTTLLTAVFSYKVAEIMPLPAKILVWGMAATTVGGGFYALFMHQEAKWCLVVPATAFGNSSPYTGPRNSSSLMHYYRDERAFREEDVEYSVKNLEMDEDVARVMPENYSPRLEP